MAQKDFIQPVKKITQELTFDFKELYSTIRSWLKDRGYDPVDEKDHSEKVKADGTKAIEISVQAEKKVDPYVKIILEFGISASVKDVVVDVEGKKSTLQEGSVTIGLGGFLKKDPESDWAIKNENPLRMFFREVYDKFVGSDKLGFAEAKLQKDIKKLIHDLKVYLKLHRFE